MTNIQVLKEELADLKASIGSDLVNDAQREMLQEAYEETLADLKKAEGNASKKDTPAPKPSEIKKARFKKEKVFYYKSGATATIDKVTQRKGKVLYKLSNRTGDITEAALLKMIGDKLFHQKPVADENPPKKNKKVVEKPISGEIEFNWRKKTPTTLIETGEPIFLATTFTAIKATEDVKLIVKDEVKKGDLILVNEEGYLHGALTPGTADKFMKKGDFQNLYVLKSTYDKLKAKKEKVDKMFVKANTAKRAAKKETNTTTSKSIKKPNSQTAKKKKAASGICNADFNDMVAILSNVIGFLEQNAMQWHKMYDEKKYKKTTREIVGVYKTTGKEDTKVLIKLRIWKPGIFKILPTFDDQWFSLCLDKWELTKMPKGSVPRRGGRKQIVFPHQLKAIYNTHGADKFKGCMGVYQELIKCQAEGTCSVAEVKAKRKKTYATCGNLGKKMVAHPQRMQLLYDEARSILKSGGVTWHQALSKAATKLKE